MKKRPFIIKLKRYNKDSLYSKVIRNFGIILTLMLMWILFWALVLKLCNHELLIRNYSALSIMTIKERLMWDLIPFNYRGTDYNIMLQKIVTVLNCFVLAPLGVTLSYSFKKRRIMLGAVISFLFILFIETTQLFTTFGNFATEDFITNTLGYFIGVAVYHILFKRIPKKATVVVLSVCTVIGVALSVYSMVTAVNSAELIFSLINRTY